MMKALVTFVFNDLVIKVVSLIIKVGKERAVYLSKKYGFEVVGRHKDNVYVNNQYYDVLLMDLYLEK